jgi:hypothetical protein
VTRSLRRFVASFFLTGLAISGPLVLACSGPDKGALERKVSSRASPGSFRNAGVSKVFEKRCGSLDCHGGAGRNLRIYSSNGLRLPNDAGLKPGTGDTTIDEITGNYESLMTLEPERSNEVIGGADPYSLLIVKKPLELEKHKGGPAIRKGDDAERCIISWLKEDLLNPIDKDACTRAAVFPKE